MGFCRRRVGMRTHDGASLRAAISSGGILMLQFLSSAPASGCACGRLYGRVFEMGKKEMCRSPAVLAVVHMVGLRPPAG